MKLSASDRNYVEERAAGFTGREWVFERIRSFLSGRSGTLLVCGPPGSGKTAVAARLAQMSAGRVGADSGSLVRVGILDAAVFCRAGRVDLLDVAQRLSAQLAGALPDFDRLQRALVPWVSVSDVSVETGNVAEGASVTAVPIVLDRLGPERAFSTGVTVPLARLADSGASRPAVLLIDALDEALGSVAHDLPRLLGELVGVKLIATARDDPRVTTQLGERFTRLHLLDDAPPQEEDDVLLYARTQLGDHGPDASMRALARRIADEAGGNFLYCTHVTQALIASGVLTDLDHATAERLPLPSGGLAGVYRDFLRRELARDESDWAERFRPILAPLAVALGDGLTTPQLAGIGSRLSGRSVSSSSARDVTRIAGQFLEGSRPHGPFRPYHQSFAEFLTDSEQNPDWSVDATETHEAIAAWLLENVPDCGEYGLKYLAAHLEQAGQAQLLHALLDERRLEQGSNDWYRAKFLAGDLNGYAADVERAWRLALTAEKVHLQTRYALYLSSLRSTNFRIPLSLLELCLEEHILTWQQALDSARLHQDRIARAQAVLRVVPHLPEDERERVIEVEFSDAAGLDDLERRSAAVLAFTGVLPERLLGKALAEAGTTPSDSQRAAIVKGLAARLSERDMDAAVKSAMSVHDHLSRVRCLAALASRPAEPRRASLLAEIKAIIQRMQPSAEKVEALCELAPLEPERREERVDEMLTIARALDYWSGLASALRAIARLGAPTVSPEHVEAALELAQRTYREADHARQEEAYVAALTALGPLLSVDQRASSIGPLVAERLSYSSWFGERAAQEDVPLLAPFLPPADRDAAFAKYVRSLVGAAAGSGSGRSLIDLVVLSESLLSLGNWRHGAALDALAQLPLHLLDAALEAADDIRSNEGRANVLATLVPRLPKERRAEILRLELGRVRAINDKAAEGQAHAALIPYAPQKTRAQLAEAALEATRAMVRHTGYFAVVASVAPHLAPDRTAVIIEQALAIARASENGRAHAQALSVLIPSLPEAAIPAALGEAQELGNDAYLALASLVPRLPVEARQGAIARVLEAVQREDRLVIIELPKDFIDVLGPIAASLSDAQLRTALALTETISRGHASLKADALTILAPRLRGSTLDQALSIAQGLSDRLSRVRAVASLAPALAEPKRTAILSDAHQTARQLDGKERVRAAVVLAPLLAERRKILSQALKAAVMIDEDDRRADALGLLLPSLVGPEQLSAFDRMLRSCLGVRVVKTVGATVFRDSIDRAFLLERIAAAAGVVQAIGGEHAVEATARAVRDATSEWP